MGYQVLEPEQAQPQQGGYKVLEPEQGSNSGYKVLEPDSGAVLNKNTTGEAEQSQDTLAPLDNSLGAQFRRTSVGQAILGPGVQPSVGIKGLVPNLQQIFHGNIKPEVSKGYGVGNFNPTVFMPEDSSYLGSINKGVISQISPENLSIIGALGKLHNSAGTGANILKALTAAYFTQQGAESASGALGTRLAGTPLTNEEKGNLDFSVGMGGLMTLSPLGLGEPVSLLDKQNQIARNQVATGDIPEYLKATPGRELTLEERNLRLQNQGPISHSTPIVKEVQTEIPANEQIALPKSAVGSTMPGGVDNGIVAGENATTISRGTLSPADLGKQLGYKVQQWDPSIPVLGGSFSLTDPKTGMTVENLRPGVSLEEVHQRMTEKNQFPTVQGQSSYEINGKKVQPTEIKSANLSKMEQEVEQRRLSQAMNDESGMIDLSGARESLDKGIENLKEFFSDEGIRRKTMKMAGVSVPRTTAANESVGNQLTMFAQAEGVAEAKARSMASEVLGKHWKDADFDNKLGAVGVEDRLRTRKAELLAQGKTPEAQSVNTLVGQPYSPIKTEAQYQQLKNAPEIKAALARHIATVQDLAEQKQTALKGALSSPGSETGAFFNLIAKGVDSGEVHKARQGNTMATLKGGTRFGKEFKGTGAEYETSYRKMAERMVKGNWTEVEKQKLFKLVDSTGFGHLQKAGEDLPTFDKPMSPIPVQRRMAVIIKPGDKPIMKSQNETLWVPEHVEGEFKQAFQTDSPLKNSLVKGVTGLVTKIQTGLGADAAFHVGNMAAAVVTSPEKATAVKLMVQNLAKTFETNPEVQRKLAAMATEAGIVREGETEVSAWKKLIPGKNMISWVDQAGRLTLDQLYQDAVKRGESPNNPVWRRAAVQGALGEYNKRLMPKVQQIMKESGLSPFLTAGKTFNRLSVRQLMLSPGRKAANIQGGAKMRLKQALYTTGLVVALPMIINNVMTGHPFPQGVEPGQFVVKKNEDGSYVVEDIAQLLMMRRGLRNTGIQAIAHGIEDKQSVGQIVKQGTKDVARGIVRPFAGPTVSALDIVTGKDALMERPDEPFNRRVKNAAQQANPTAEVLLNKDESKTTNEKLIGRFGRTIGLKVTQTGVSRINGLARDWKERNNVPLDNSPRGPYFDLTSALRKNDAQAARKALSSVNLADKKDELIKQYYDKIATKPFTDSNEHEKQFVSELSDEDKKVYQSVKDSNAQVRERFYNIFMGRPAPRLAREGREERPARENKFLPR